MTFNRPLIRDHVAPRHSRFDYTARRFGIVKDATRASDPTNTGALRAEFSHQVDRRAQLLKKMVSEVMGKADAFGLSQLNAQNIMVAATDDKLKAFADWLMKAASAVILDHTNGGWVGMYVGGGYKEGLAHARTQTGMEVDTDPRRGNVFSVRAANELRGIVGATEQRMNRAFADGINSRHLGRDIIASVISQIDDVFVKRASLLVEHSVVNAHAEASLDAMEALGFTAVSLKGETCIVHDAKKSEEEKDVAEHRPLSRVPKKKPKNWKQYRRFVTAGDEDVCPVCEDLEGNVYLISEARGLIPVHPWCRCAFVPHFDKRYAKDFSCDPVTPTPLRIVRPIIIDEEPAELVIDDRVYTTGYFAMDVVTLKDGLTFTARNAIELAPNPFVIDAPQVIRVALKKSELKIKAGSKITVKSYNDALKVWNAEVHHG